MDLPARLPWRRDKDRFVAFPTATEHEERFAEIRLHGIGRNTDVVPHHSIEQWLWRVHWLGWFNETGYTSGKQDAADKATEGWWQSILTDVPRDVDLEAAMIAARALVRPPPNSLLGEESAFLHKVVWNLNNIYGAEIKNGDAPLPIKELMDRLSEEFLRRRMRSRSLKSPSWWSAADIVAGAVVRPAGLPRSHLASGWN